MIRQRPRSLVGVLASILLARQSRHPGCAIVGLAPSLAARLAGRVPVLLDHRVDRVGYGAVCVLAGVLVDQRCSGLS